MGERSLPDLVVYKVSPRSLVERLKETMGGSGSCLVERKFVLGMYLVERKFDYLVVSKNQQYPKQADL